jgi:hypothetical protein
MPAKWIPKHKAFQNPRNAPVQQLARKKKQSFRNSETAEYNGFFITVTVLY